MSRAASIPRWSAGTGWRWRSSRSPPGPGPGAARRSSSTSVSTRRSRSPRTTWCRESLANIGKHAQADVGAVAVARADGDLVVEVVDDGVGGADTERGSGLRGLADRVEALGGRLRVWTPRGGGTRVRAEIPCA